MHEGKNILFHCQNNWSGHGQAGHFWLWKSTPLLQHVTKQWTEWMIFKTHLHVKRPWATTLDTDDLNLRNSKESLCCSTVDTMTMTSMLAMMVAIMVLLLVVISTKSAQNKNSNNTKNIYRCGIHRTLLSWIYDRAIPKDEYGCSGLEWREQTGRTLPCCGRGYHWNTGRQL